MLNAGCKHRSLQAIACASPCESGRGDWIRTSDFYVPNVALYQAELHPESSGGVLYVGFWVGSSLFMQCLVLRAGAGCGRG